MPDIVAVGFQEIVPLSASNVVMGTAPHCKKRLGAGLIRLSQEGHVAQVSCCPGASFEAAATWDHLIARALDNGNTSRNPVYVQVGLQHPHACPCMLGSSSRSGSLNPVSGQLNRGHKMLLLCT